MDIFKIAFTGGPCALKTTTINKVKEKLNEDGYYVIVVPETAAELIKAGILPNSDEKHTSRFQELVLEKQLNKETIAEEYAKLLKDNNTDLIKDKKGIIILYDRSIMDNRAYLSYEGYNKLLNNYNINELTNLNKFDLVLDLISTATLKPEFYALDGVRYETVEEAAYRDMLTSSAWLLHKNLKVVKPTEKEEDKINIVLNHIYDLINGKQNNNLKVYDVNDEETNFSNYNNDNSRSINIKTVHLKSFDGRKFVIDKQSYNNHNLFIKTEYIKGNIPKSNEISREDYLELLNTNILDYCVEKEVLHCIDNGEYYNFEISNSGIKLYTELDESMIPKNIVLKKIK